MRIANPQTTNLKLQLREPILIAVIASLGAGALDERILRRAAPEDVGSGPAQQAVGAVLAEEVVALAHAVQHVVALAAVDRVAARGAAQRVVALAAEEAHGRGDRAAGLVDDGAVVAAQQVDLDLAHAVE